MLSYKEYKLLNESLYGAFNLGLRGHATVGGIVSDSSVNGTEAALEAESEEALEEAKKGKKMKKKMFGDEDDVVKRVRVSDDDHDDEDEDHEDDEDEDEDEDHDDDEDSDDSDDSDDEDGDEDDEGDDDHEKSEKGREFAFMKKKSKKHMKKKSKKEWSEVMSDLEDILEGIDDEDALLEVKKGLQMMKKGMQKGVDGSKANNDPKSQIDKSIEYHGSRGMKKHMGSGCKKCGKKCGKNMSESDAAWWNSVNGMLGADPDQKHWDGGWKQVGEVEQAVRENTELKKKVISEAEQGIYGVTGDPDYPYATKRGPDLYYNSGHSEEQIMMLFQKAKNALYDFQNYAEAMAMKGDLAPIRALDALYDGLASGPDGKPARHAEGLTAHARLGYIRR